MITQPEKPSKIVQPLRKLVASGLAVDSPQKPFHERTILYRCTGEHLRQTTAYEPYFRQRRNARFHSMCPLSPRLELFPVPVAIDVEPALGIAMESLLGVSPPRD
jgi:hypothetical protein